MIVYSKKIIQFINDIKWMIKEIISKEIVLRVYGERFYDRAEGSSYPIRVVIYNNKSMLGYFDPSFYELGFHECLMYTKKEQLHSVIRHELAHYMTYINHGAFVSPHGHEFKDFCDRMRWGDDISKSTICLESEQNAPDVEENSVLRKVQKLMALAGSSNENEAEQAMIKSQQLLLKHNLESKYFEEKDEEKIVLKRVLKQKKENAKMRSIAHILSTFFVSTVYNRSKEHIYLEILGTPVNVDIAEYVADFLNSELERLWLQAQKMTSLKGMIAKNSFFLGLATGYCNKIQSLNKEYDKDITHALMVIEKKLTDAKEMVYQRLSHTKSSGNYCEKSGSLGELMGKQLSINPAINKSSGSAGTMIGFLG